MVNLSRWLRFAVFALTCTGASKGTGAEAEHQVEADMLLKGGTLIDGTGAPRR